jgi:hypothetical protein
VGVRTAAPWLAWGLYVALVARAVWHHEPWADEAQAWLLARDSGLWQLLWHELRYEGSPGLWHVLLWCLARTGLPFQSMQWLAAASASAGALLLLLRTPLPWPVRLLAPFSFFLLFQYAAVARSYALLPPLLFGLVWLWPRREARPGAFVLLLALLANVSLHGLVMAGGLFGAHLLGVAAGWRQRDAVSRRRSAVSALALLAVAGCVVAQLWPPPDLYVASGATGLEVRAPKADAQAFDALAGGLAGLRLPTAGLLAFSLAWFAHRRTLALYLLPTLGLLGVLGLKYRSDWHDGTLFLTWLTVLAISFHPDPAGARPEGQQPRLRRWMVVAAVATLLLHMWWSERTMKRDLAMPYSGGPAAAAYLRAHGLQQRTLHAVGFWTLSVQPHFERNVFANLRNGAPAAHWRWSTREARRDTPEDVARDRPDYLLVADKADSQAFAGYVLEASFPGKLFFKHYVYETDGMFLLRREDLPPPVGTAPAEHGAPARP